MTMIKSVTIERIPCLLSIFFKWAKTWLHQRSVERLGHERTVWTFGDEDRTRAQIRCPVRMYSLHVLLMSQDRQRKETLERKMSSLSSLPSSSRGVRNEKEKESSKTRKVYLFSRCISSPDVFFHSCHGLLVALLLSFLLLVVLNVHPFPFPYFSLLYFLCFLPECLVISCRQWN
jgi:hypothetical protein